MFSNLYAWLVLHKELAVPGIGTFLLNRESAQIDFPNKKILPPSYSISLESSSYTPGQDFFKWLGTALGISQREAIFRFNDFVFDLRKNISEGTIVNWQGVGALRKGIADEMEFVPESTIPDGIPVVAEKIIREKATVKVLVGEQEKTAEIKPVPDQEDKKSYWWVYSLTIAVLALMFTGWWLSEHGISVANINALVPQEPVNTTYQVIQ